MTERHPDGMGRLVPFPGKQPAPTAPVVGELVDTDRDGVPDTTHPPGPTTAIEPRADDHVEVAEKVYDGELVDEADYRVSQWRHAMSAQPVVPPWLRDGQQRITAAKWAGRYAWHRARFHALRCPVYLARLAARTPRGIRRAATGWGRWAFATETTPLRLASVLTGDPVTYVQLTRIRQEQTRHRLIGSGVSAAVLSGGLVAMDVLWPVGWWLVVPTVTAALGVLGRRPDKPIVTTAVVGHQVKKLTASITMRAFNAAGLAKESDPITFPQEIQRDGKGWLAVIDLPDGRTAKQAMAKRESLASALHVPTVMVFLDPDPLSAGRVRLWVSDIDVFAQKPVPSPLAKLPRFDFWQPIPFGVDARDQLVTMPLIWSSLLVGAIPRQGKTFAARIPAAAAALDPYVLLYVFNGKGCSAWRPFEQVAHVYGSGVRDEVVDLLVLSLEGLVDDMNARYERMSALPTDVCPDAKLTPALARNRRMDMPLTLVSIDEVQRYLEHAEHGGTILALLTDLAKVGPAAGIMLSLATQKPDSKVIPDSLRGQIGTRLAMKVMTYQASDTILGAGSYSAGMDASELLKSHKGVGILLGADDGELAERGGQTVRSHLLGGEDLDAVCARGRVLRETEGTLTGMAAGQRPVTEARPARVLDDVAAAFEPGEDKAWSQVLVARLAERNPGAYDGWSPTQLATALEPYGVAPVQVWGTDEETGKGANRRGYVRDEVTDALAARLDKH